MPAVVTDTQRRNAPVGRLRADGPANNLDNVLGQVIANNAADIIGPENFRPHIHLRGLSQNRFILVKQFVVEHRGIAEAQDVFIAIHHIHIGNVVLEHGSGAIGGKCTGPGGLAVAILAGLVYPAVYRQRQPVQHFAG